MAMVEMEANGTSALPASEQILTGNYGVSVDGSIGIDENIPPYLKDAYPPKLDPPIGTLTAPEDDNEGSVEIKLYPDITFQFNAGWIDGIGSIAPSSESRSRAVFSALQKGWKEYDGPDYREAEQLFRKFNQHYLAGKIKLDSETEVSRSDILNLDDQLDALMDEYFRTHHPVAQLMSQLALEFPELPKGIVRDIQRRVVLAVDHDRIKEIYAAAIKSAKIGHSAVSAETKD